MRVRKRELVITEVYPPDGGVGICIGNDPMVFRGYSLADVQRAVEALVMGDIDPNALPSYGKPWNLDASTSEHRREHK